MAEQFPIVPHPNPKFSDRYFVNTKDMTVYDRQTGEVVPPESLQEAPPTGQSAAPPDPQRPGWVQALQRGGDWAAQNSPLAIAQAHDPLSPELPFADKMWTTAMLFGPEMAQSWAVTKMPGLASGGFFPALGRTAFATGGGTVAGIPFGKPEEGAMTGGTAAGAGEFLNYLGRGANWLWKGGVPGVMKRVQNIVSDATGLGKVSKTGEDILPNVSDWKKSYYDTVYDPLKAQASANFPQGGAPSPLMKKMFDEGHGQGVIPKSVWDQMEAAKKTEDELTALTEKTSKAKETYAARQQVEKQLLQNNPNMSQEEKAALAAETSKANEAYQAAVVEDMATKEMLKSLPRFQNIGKEPVVSFGDYEKTLENLRQYGWNNTTGEARQGPLSASERSMLHDLKDEMLGHLPDQALAAQYGTARDHAHGWEAWERMVKNSEYTKGFFRNQTDVQKEFIDHFDEIVDAFGRDKALDMTRELFGGRADLEHVGRPWGGEHGTLHAGSGIGTTLRSHFMPPALVRPNVTPGQLAGQTGIPAAILSQGNPPSQDQSLVDQWQSVGDSLFPQTPGEPPSFLRRWLFPNAQE